MSLSTDLNIPEERPLKPFVIEHRKLDMQPDGSFRPAATTLITSGLRTSGLLALLPGEDVKTLLCLWTFLSPNGTCQATEQQIAQALRTSAHKAHIRMKRLEELTWEKEPIVRHVVRESGLDTLTPSLKLYSETTYEPLESGKRMPAAAPVASREAVVAYSREHYARPRAEVEREMAELNGWPIPQQAATTRPADKNAAPAVISTDEQALASVRRRLIGLGVPRREVNRLLTCYDVSRVQRQLNWLPLRNARNRAGFIVAAINGDYEEPRER